jgi:hypothetical protein
MTPNADLLVRSWRSPRQELGAALAVLDEVQSPAGPAEILPELGLDEMMAVSVSCCTYSVQGCCTQSCPTNSCPISTYSRRPCCF